ncbi:MTH938/NDUFAF3 family protein [Micromonospora sp. CPCC 206060]|uniref:Mth938-like domain-containing protein n=1 Tax=Micromonospora sp. CPCC 206060 TaxID=3122406 RepID=UPI002FEFB269
MACDPTGTADPGGGVDTERRSPRILDLSWGRMEVAGLGVGKDFRLHPGGGRPWDWTETGTRHQPGIQPADVEELLAHGATTVVLSQGMDRRLEVHPDTLALLAERGVEVHVAETRQAAAIYNELADHTPVGGLFHSTC